MQLTQTNAREGVVFQVSMVMYIDPETLQYNGLRNRISMVFQNLSDYVVTFFYDYATSRGESAD